jgi:ABC-type transport system substrate-binding protein
VPGVGEAAGVERRLVERPARAAKRLERRRSPQGHEPLNPARHAERAGTDPDTSENIWATGAGRNFIGYSNPEVDRLFAEGRRELDRAKRAEKYARIQEILHDDQPYTWLYWRNSFYGFSKSLRGYVFSPRGPYHYSPGFGSLWMPKTE